VVDLENDRLEVQYEPAKVTVPALLETVRKQGFTATIVPAGAKAGAL
jgi:hypothetical protein